MLSGGMHQWCKAKHRAASGNLALATDVPTCHVCPVRAPRRRARNLRNATHDSRSTHDHIRRRRRSDGNEEVRPRHEAERGEEEHAARAGGQETLRRKEERREAQQFQEECDQARWREAQQQEERVEALLQAELREEEHDEAQFHVEAQRLAWQRWWKRVLIRREEEQLAPWRRRSRETGGRWRRGAGAARRRHRLRSSEGIRRDSRRSRDELTRSSRATDAVAVAREKVQGEVGHSVTAVVHRDHVAAPVHPLPLHRRHH
jgi:hypothetical protein